jgi:hypothetical protein
MDTQPQRHDAHDHDQAVSTWLASEAFTDFITLTFGVAVKQAVDEQVAKGVIQPR